MKIRKNRFIELDALRGVAALVVVIHHLMMSLPTTENPVLVQIVKFTPLRILIAGHGAVIIFFVLSGFVLASLLSHSMESYGFYVRRRAIRIYLPYIAALVLAIFVSLITHGGGQLQMFSPWYSGISNINLSLNGVFGAIFLLGRVDDITLNSPMWSLVQELRISFLFPLMFFSIRRWPLPTVIFSIIVNLMCSYFLRLGSPAGDIWALMVRQDTATSLLITLYYVIFFVAGAFLYLNHSLVQIWIGEGWIKPAIGFFLALAVMMGPSTWMISDYMFGFGALVLVGLLASGKARTIFSSPLLQRAGRISFSLYLTHTPVMILAFFLLQNLPFSAIYSITFILILISAELFYRFVEKPSHQLSQRMASSQRSLSRAF